jgi:GTP-binding protein YchF
MKIGLIGFAGSGKTTVFNALTGLGVETDGAHDRLHLGVIKVLDARVDLLAEVFKLKKKVYPEISFIDAAGQERSSLDPKIIQQMRDADALVHVVRGFNGSDPARDIMALEDELILSDLVQIENRISRLKKERDSARELELFNRLKSALESGSPLRELRLSHEELNAIAGFRFMSLKPLLLLLNLSEDQMASGPKPELLELARSRGLELMAMCGKLEMEIAQLDPQEQREFLEELGMSEPARDRFIKACYSLLDLISFLTYNESECRAWPIKRGTTAQKAAGKIHSDIERGFIRAEVVRFDDLISCGSLSACRQQGKLRLEGKDYVVQDGDVIHFRFNV